MTRLIIKEQPGQVTVTDESGARFFNEKGEEIMSFDGDWRSLIGVGIKLVNLGWRRMLQEGQR